MCTTKSSGQQLGEKTDSTHGSILSGSPSPSTNPARRIEDDRMARLVEGSKEEMAHRSGIAARDTPSRIQVPFDRNAKNCAKR